MPLRLCSTPESMDEKSSESKQHYFMIKGLLLLHVHSIYFPMCSLQVICREVTPLETGKISVNFSFSEKYNFLFVIFLVKRAVRVKIQIRVSVAETESLLLQTPSHPPLLQLLMIWGHTPVPLQSALLIKRLCHLRKTVQT